MPDSRFFTSVGPFELNALADMIGAEIQGAPNGGLEVRDVAPLQSAGPQDISFFDNKAYREAFENSAAGACIVAPDTELAKPDDMTLLVVADPYKGYASIARAFYPEIESAEDSGQKENIAPTAKLGSGVLVGPGAVIGPRAEIGDNCRIAANAIVGAAVELGAGCFIGPGASVRFCIAGERVHIAAGVRIGEDGFGYASSAAGHLKVPQLGRVVIGDGVEIGANSTIDRGSGPDTVIGAGAIIDNLVQVAHNVQIGRNCILVAQVGISGSAILGDNVVIGGQSGVTGHLTVGSGARVAAKSGVMSDVPEGATYVGAPAMPQKEFWRQMVALKRLASRKADS
jgi:UDP-3-O-[3-hydroxymyristoyl] glucosamine N-acyltransferase